MNKTTIFSFILIVLFSLAGFAQGHETFDDVGNSTGNAYVDGTFQGQDGSTWTHVQTRGDAVITGQAIMLGRNRTPDSYVESGIIPNGIGNLKFSYKQEFSNNVNLDVYVNGNLVYTATTSGQQGDILTTADIAVNISGDVVIKFDNANGAQVTIDDVIWTAMGNDPTLTITSPTNGSEFSPLETPTIEFNVDNFDISTNATAGDGDGYIQYQVDQDPFVDYFSTNPIVLNNLNAGSHDVTLQLVDNNGDALSPGVNSTVNFTVNEITDVNNIGALRTSDIGAYYNLTEEVVLTYQQNFRGQKYIQDATGAILIDDDAGVLTENYNQYDGITGISGKLQEHNGLKQFVPIVDANVATSSNNAINIVVLSINDYMANPGAYESQVITFENVTFLDADGTETFDTGENYDITDGVDTSIMRTNFFDADYIGSIIPGGIQPAISGIASHFQGNGQIFPRDMNDLTGAAPSLCEAVTNVNVTNIDETTATIGWDAATSASDGYIIDVFEEGANPNVDTPIFNDTVAAGITTVQATGLIPGTDYDVYVTSDCGGGDTATSAAVTFTTDSVSSTIVDREADNTNGLISTKGNNNTGVYGADYFELTASVDLGDIRFYGFPSEGPDFLPTLTGFNVVIFEHSGTTPDGDPETTGSGFIELTNIAPADFDYVSGVFTINATQANGGQTVTLPAGEYWIAAYPSVSTPPTGDGRWNWLGSLSATPTYESVLIDPADLFGAGATSWTPITTLIAEPFPSFAWTMTEDGDTLPLASCELFFTNAVEPITKVVFADIDNSSSAVSTDDIEDFTHIEGEVEQGKSYTIELEGDTGGPYDSYFTVWIDWNQNGIWESLTDEMYEIGFINNSTGADGIQATATITVPQDATLGNTTMRIIKNFGISPTDPCSPYNYGQAEDYTIVVIEPTALCEVVTNINVTNIDETTAAISWDAATSASDGYIIDVFEEGANPNVDTPIFNDSVATGITTVQATGLTPGTDYDVYVTSDCGGGDTATSTAVTFTTDSTSSAIVDREADNTTGLISTKGNDNTGVYAADYFELTASVDLGDIRFYGFPSEGPDFLPTLTGFNVVIFEHSGTTPDGDPETTGSGFIELTDIASADFDYVDGVFTINATQANGGQTVTLPAGEYWISAYPSVSTPPTGDGRWNWLGSLSATPTYESVLIDLSDLFGAGATSWTLISTLIAPDPFPSLAWTMTEDGDVLPPVPCEVTISSTVEPITKVVFAGIDNSSSASSTDPVEDFTHIEGEVEQGESYTIELEGYTGGNFDSYFTVWIDWNQDGVWDSSPSSEEMYEIGFITNSTGTDGIQATGTINVPQNATLGNATMRIVKNYGTSPTDPCGTYGWGQAEDYTIVVIEPTPLCEAVTNINVTSISKTTATIGWDAAAGASDGYIIDVFEEGADPSVAIPVFNDTVATGITTVQATGLTAGTDYDVYVTSDCGGGDTATSTAVTFTTEALDCDAVTGISVTAITQTTATVSWVASATATDGYVVDVYESGTTTAVVFTDTLAAGATSASVTGLSANTDYDVYVISECGGGDIATSTAVAFTTEALDCDVVTGVDVTAITQTTATVSWTASATATDGYVVDVYESGTTTGAVFTDTLAAATTSAAITGLSANTDYDVYVTSDCGSGATATTAAHVFTTDSCDAVTNIDVTAITQTSATVSWTASATASDGYEVNVYEVGTTNLVTTETAMATETSVDLTGLEPATSYDVIVTSDCGEVTMDSDTFTFTTEAIACDAVTDVEVSDIAVETATVSWTASATAVDGYVVDVYEAGADVSIDTPVFTEAVASGVTTVDITGLAEQTLYDVYVTSDCGSGETATSDVVTFITHVLVGVGDFSFANLELFPNPASTNLNISATKIIEEIQVYNVLGQLVMTQKFNDANITLDVSSLSTATYLLKVKVDGVIGTVRFVKK